MNKDCGKLTSVLIILFSPHSMRCNPQFPASLRLVNTSRRFPQDGFPVPPNNRPDLRLIKSLTQDYIAGIFVFVRKLKFLKDVHQESS